MCFDWLIGICLLGLGQGHGPLDHLPATPLPQDGVVADLLSSAQARHLVVALALQGKYYTGYRGRGSITNNTEEI